MSGIFVFVGQSGFDPSEELFGIENDLRPRLDLLQF